ncbi:Cytochrome P450 4V2, partial [Araneus ventricosus]
LMDTLRKRVEQFNKEQLFCVWVLYEPIIVLIKVDAVQEMLMGVKMNDKSWLYNRLHHLIGSGLITSKGDKWKSRRRLLMPCFHTNMLRRFLTNFNEGAQKLVTSLQEETKNDFTFIANPIKLCALEIIFETIFGVKMNASENKFSEYIYSLNRITDLFMKSVFTPWQWPSIIFWNSKSGKEYKHHCQVLQQFTRKIIREKKECYLRGETDTRQGKQKALMDLLLQKHFETQELSEEDIREEVDTFTAAGYETTATSIVWALYLIGLYPDVQAKLHEEIDQIFEKDTERHVTERDLQDLQYLDCVLKESNRLYSTVPIFVRQANEDTTVCGYTIPKGTSCAVLTYFLHRDEEVFPDPDAFKPERFLPENISNIPTCAYIPFAAGPRKCIGYKFAEMEMKIIVSSILRNFTIESLDERSKIQPLLKVTLQPSTPIRIRIRPISKKRFI